MIRLIKVNISLVKINLGILQHIFFFEKDDFFVALFATHIFFGDLNFAMHIKGDIVDFVLATTSIVVSLVLLGFIIYIDNFIAKATLTYNRQGA